MSKNGQSLIDSLVNGTVTHSCETSAKVSAERIGEFSEMSIENDNMLRNLPKIMESLVYKDSIYRSGGI